MMNIYTQPAERQITPVISMRRYGELEFVVIDHPNVRGAVSLQGAQLVSWQPAGEEEVIWLSPQTAYENGVPLRGGVPICWPWFGAASQPGLPAHGFARNLRWQLSAHHEQEQGVMLTFELHHSAATQRDWAHEFTLYARFKLAQSCDIELEAHGDFTTTGALHSYFQVGDIRAVQVSGLGRRFIDKVAQGKEGELADGVQQFAQRTDRIYLQPEACSLIDDSALDRLIEVIHHHHSNVVCWNPGAQVAANLPDMPDNGYQHFVCVETACVTQPQTASQHKPSRLCCTLQVKRGS